MKYRVTVGSIATLLAILCNPNAAAAQSSVSAPVTIDSCTPIIAQTATAPTPAPIFGGIQLASSSSGMAIDFVNTTTKTANLVNFAVDSNGQRFIIRDVGTFSPGISINHKYRNGAGQAFVLPQFIAPRVTCSVASVRFVDGSVWRPGQPTQMLPPSEPAANPLTSSALSAYPARLVIDSVADAELFLVSSTKRVAAFKESDDCAGIATVFVAATGESTATYSVKPAAPGKCTARVADEEGDSLSYPIVVR
jgi:hypothetical protein